MIVVKHHNKCARWRSIKGNQMTPQYRLMTGLFQKGRFGSWAIFISKKIAHVNSYKFIAKLIRIHQMCERPMRVGGWNFPYSQ